MTVPTKFATQFHEWWDELIAEGRRCKFPYLVDQEVLGELAALEPDAPERQWIYEILIDWLASPDSLRWQPALGILSRERVPGAANAMRAAVSPANTGEKERFHDTFHRVAAELDAALGDVDSDPGQTG